MIEVTATDLRKDLFNILDRVERTGESLRVSRRGRSITLKPATAGKSAADMTPQERFDRWMAKGPRQGAENSNYDPSDTSHWEWDPEKKFKDLLKP
ncbi:type II toxin-antitoxin system prevent-host-death family antitoxin [Brevundimonas sp. NIBR11]|uniref:type II toxin-antitoxin system prevent-host-death family antitoxin n=1 Tax=Brevundimonas sp. NIBR11 TaxID=3015999 RepID=UPI0022F12ABB|nr:type II toxin-antitoxin system prevent-host-death family antitoxin [Brevundimonas sp. NIBR11]